MNQNLLLVTPMGGAEECATSVGRQLGLGVEVASDRRTALASLRRREYAVVVLDETLVESDPGGTDVLWQHFGLAVPLQINLGIYGCNRLLREVRSALQRREKELSLAMRAAVQLLEGEMNNAITGLLLQTQLALAEPGLPANAAIKLQQAVELATSLREILRNPSAG